MKKNFSRLLVLLLSLAILASQMMVPAFAADSSVNCSCNAANRTGKLLDEVEATCTEYGIKTYECDKCGKQYSEYFGTPTGEHTTETVLAKAPTCTEIGWAEYEYCTVCSYTTYEEIPANGHSTLGEGPKAPTCTETGHTGWDKCLICGVYTKYAEIIPSNGHTEVVDEAVAPTCTETGLTEGSHCSVCGVVIVAQEEVPATGHNGLPTEGVVSETCTEGAYTVYECQTCKEHYKVYDPQKPATGHTKADAVKENVVAPTCEKDGSHDEVVYCKTCNVELSRVNVIDVALGHDMKKGKTVAPTCSAEGYTVYTCANGCGKTENRDITPVDLTKHNPVVTKPYIAATCTSKGQTAEVECSLCGIILRASTEIDTIADNHNVVIDKAVAPTCTETGLKEGSHCSLCNEVLVPQEVVPALGHKEKAAVKENEVANSCISDGSYDSVVYCSVCKEELSRETIVVPATKHDYGTEPVRVVAATCTDKPYEVYVCVTCGYEYIHYTGEALGHITMGEGPKAPTCTETGHTGWDKCIVCGVYTKYAEIIPANGHTILGAAPKAPTCTEMGHTGWDKCLTCGVYTKYAEYIPANGHTEEVIPGYAATFDAHGLTDGVKCTTCNEILVAQEVIPVKNEKVTFTYKATGVNGADKAVNTGYVTFEIWMNVETDQARLWGVDIDLKFDERLTIIDGEDAVKGNIFETIGYTPIAIANNNHSIKINQSMPFTLDPTAVADKTFSKGEYLYATITFKVADDCENSVSPLTFDIETAAADDCAYSRVTTTNEIEVDFGTGSFIYVDKLGDINDDGVINVQDSMAFVQWLSGADLEDYDTVCDMDKNGTINSADFALLRGAIVGDETYLTY